MTALLIGVCAAGSVLSQAASDAAAPDLRLAQGSTGDAALLPIAPGQTVVTAPQDVDPTGPIGFTVPLTQGGEALVGKTIEQLVLGSPLFAPIEGIPDSLWQGKHCKDCHGWTRAALCTQGATYIDDPGHRLEEVRHPYGGPFKRTLKVWAAEGCN